MKTASPTNKSKKSFTKRVSFTSDEQFNAWIQRFKQQLWQDDPNKVKMVEGIYVDKQYITVDDTTPPRQIRQYATFRKGVSYYYAADEQLELA